MRGTIFRMENHSAASLVPEFKLSELSFENKYVQIFRATDANQRKVILKLIRPKYGKVFDPVEGRMLKQEYEIVRRLVESPRIIRFKSLLEHESIPFGIVEEDDGSMSLIDTIPRQGYDIPTFLNIAIQICEGISHIHKHNIFHKDIKPSNLVYNYKAGALKLIDFGSASLLKEEISTPTAHTRLGGTLGYISPEQTGRNNRTVDYRTDFYSLGITFYQLLTGVLPFNELDPEALIRAHLATVAKPLHEVNPKIPRALSDLVAKLMMKNVDDRYQSADGILFDLRKIQESPQEDFQIAMQDFAVQLQISGNLFGRKKEVRTLLDSFERVCNTGKPEVILVTGSPGIGKSTLINEIQKPIAIQSGRFVLGKYDQLNQAVAYSAISQALQLFVRQILGEGTETISSWKSRILKAVGDKAQLLIDVIPQLEIILGPQPSVIPLDPIPAKSRFQTVFAKFIGVLSEDQDHPLVLFLDDLQWADYGSLELIRFIMTARNDATRLVEGDTPADSFFLLIGAYRDNEMSTEEHAVSTIHLAPGKYEALTATFEDIKKALTAVKTIKLAPLDQLTVQQWIAFSIGASIQYIRTLSEVVYAKTHGNPFFVKMFLRSLNDDKFLTFSAEQQMWVWDIDVILKSSATTNVVDFLVEKMAKLPATTREILFIGACLGHKFTVETLLVILPQYSMDTLLEEIRLICNSGMAYQIEVEWVYFAHDRIQEAAFLLYDGEHKKLAHLDIARHLEKYYDLEKQPKKILEIIEQYNIGYKFTLINNPEVLRHVIEVNFRAIQVARDAVAFVEALAQCNILLDILIRNFAPSSGGRDVVKYLWDAEYDVMYKVYNNKAELELILGNASGSETVGHELLRHAKTAIEKAEIAVVMINVLTTQGKNEQAIQTSKDALQLIDFELPAWDQTVNFDEELARHIDLITKTWSASGSSILDILKITPTQNREHVAIQKLLSAVFMSLFIFRHDDLYYLVVSRAVMFALKTGYTSESALAFAFYSGILCENPQTVGVGNEFGKLALNLIDQYNDVARKCNVYQTVAMLSYHFVKPIKECEIICNQAFQYGIESCEAVFIPFTRYLLGILYFVGGRNLHSLIGECEKLLDFCKKKKCMTSTNILRTVINAAKFLTGEKKWKLSQKSKHVDFLRSHNITSALASEYVFKSQIYFRFGQYGESLKFSMEADGYIRQLGTTLIAPDHNFYRSLSLAALIRGCQNKEDKRIIDFKERLISNQVAMKAWADSCPENFLHKYMLIEAELHWIDGKYWEASELYENAIRYAHANGFVQDEALANELTGIFWISHRRESFACMYITAAINCYTRWGATSKANLLKEAYRTVIYSNSVNNTTQPQFQNSSSSSSYHSHSTSSRNYSTDYSSSYRSNSVSNKSTPMDSAMDNVLWDMENVIKASQTISSGIDLDKILYNMMDIIMKTAGAQKGALFLDSQSGLALQAECVHSQIVVSQGTPLLTWDGPHKVIQYVHNTGQAVILANASEDQQFRQNPYIAKHSVRSLLCMPIMKQDVVEGVLYVENSDVNGAFNQNRETVLNILMTQMAISLDNARLVRRQLEEQRKRAADAEQNKIKLEEFIDTICHEMRNPLNGIYGGVTLLQDEIKIAQTFSAQIKEDSRTMYDQFINSAIEQIETISKCAEQQKVIVNDVLDLSKLESNKIELNPIRFNLRSVISTVMQMCSPQAKQANVKISINVEDGAVQLVADSHRLSQILINIVSNAVKFTKEGSIEIFAYVREAKDQTADLYVSVKDTGIGMNEQEQSGLFDRFGQASRHISSQYGGSGLGLVICKKLVERMGGTITVKSQKSVGSTFTFSVKVEVAEGVFDDDVVVLNDKGFVPISASSSTSSSSDNASNRSTNILLVEDNLMNQRVLTNYLNQQQYLCEVASNGQEAIDQFVKFDFDIILMDIEMPVLSGLEATKRIRQMEAETRRRRVPIIGLSGNARTAQVEEALSMGFDNYITKPFHRDEIFAMIEKYAQR